MNRHASLAVASLLLALASGCAEQKSDPPRPVAPNAVAPTPEPVAETVPGPVAEPVAGSSTGPGPVAATPAAPPAATPPPVVPASTAWAPPTLGGAASLAGLKVNKVAAPAAPVGSAGSLLPVDGSLEANLGALVQGQVVEHTFLLENQGSEALVLSGTHNSCGCTVSSVARVLADGQRVPFVYGEALAPGDRLELSARVDTDGKKGLLVSTVTLQTNAAVPPAPLRVSADVKPFLVLQPETYLMLGRMMTNEVREQSLEIHSSNGEPFALEWAQAGAPEFLHVNLVPNEPGSDGRASHWKALVRVGPGAQEGANLTFGLRFVSDVPLPGGAEGRTHTALSYVVVEEITGLVRASPNFLSFGIVRPGATVTRTVRIENLDPEFTLPDSILVERLPRNLPSDEVLAKSLFTRVEVIEPGKVVEVTVTIADLPDTMDGDVGGMLAVHVGHPTRAVLNVPYSGLCRTMTRAPQSGAGSR